MFQGSEDPSHPTVYRYAHPVRVWNVSKTPYAVISNIARSRDFLDWSVDSRSAAMLKARSELNSRPYLSRVQFLLPGFIHSVVVIPYGSEA